MPVVLIGVSTHSLLTCCTRASNLCGCLSLATMSKKLTQTAEKRPVVRFSWIRIAVIRTGGCTLLGLITAALLVIASYICIPGFADFDYDLGLQMQSWAAV